ncbi:MAG: MarR family winged helix-turn-helix transcriptional regulator [Candidatus Heimdallarchaeota archaeon]|nr:MarR family winged helix-turn-helix transcriptional regulator [Candidatus Heimdallarchaeota archaeon]MDH5645075.1 MarR family winged helix-turn-helix transcriptional regulator [Candidatus Heimdallarchaeota archaeon]
MSNHEVIQSPLLLAIIMMIFIFSFVIIRFYGQVSSYVERDILEGKYLRILNSKHVFDDDLFESNQDLVIHKMNAKFVDEVLDVAVPEELIKHSFLLNPIRLGIIKILYDYQRHPSSEIRKMLGVTWGKFTSQVQALEKKGFLSTEEDFIDGNTRKMLYLEAHGHQKFKNLADILVNINKKIT